MALAPAVGRRPRTWMRAVIPIALFHAAVALGGAPGDAALMDALDGIRERQGIAGVALVLTDRTGIRYAGARGLADRAQGRALTPDTPVRIGSITKTFNGLLFLRLDRDGSLPLDTPLRSLAPDAPLDNPWEGERPVRIVHLLEHTAGLADLAKDEFDRNAPFTDLRAALAFRPGARRALWPPGLHHSYSNAGAGLAAYAAERATGQTYEALAIRLALAPLGIPASGLRPQGPPRSGLAVGYDSDGRTPIPYWHMIFPALGAIEATPREMAALPRLLLGRGTLDGRRLLPAAAIDRMERPATTLAAAAGLGFGYGLGLDSYVDQGLLWHGHGGDGDGYLSHFAYQNDLGMGYFVTVNAFRSAALGEMKRAVRAHLAAGRTPAPEPPVPVLPGAVLDALAGRYAPAVERFVGAAPGPAGPAGAPDRSWEIRREGRGLRARGPQGESRPLVPVTARLFRQPGEPLATSAFARQGGTLYWQGEDGSLRRRADP